MPHDPLHLPSDTPTATPSPRVERWILHAWIAAIAAALLWALLS